MKFIKFLKYNIKFALEIADRNHFFSNLVKKT